MGGVLLFVGIIALLVALKVLFDRGVRPATFYAPNVSVDELVAKLTAGGGLPKRRKQFSLVNLANGDLSCQLRGFNQAATDVLIHFVPDANGVGIAVQPTYLTRQNGLNVSGGFVWRIKRGVARVVAGLPAAAT